MMEQHIQQVMAAFGLPQGSRVTVALSGGMDSVTLLYLLKELPGRQFTLEAAHVNHGLRGEYALRDQQFCQALCREWQIPLQIFEGDAAAYAREHGMSPEEGARALRYGFLDPLATEDGAFVATAHHQGDQAETFFINLYRGSGSRGLAGISRRRGNYLRPLLELDREAIAAFAAEKQLSYVTDETNADPAYLRNFLRHKVLPLLESRAEGHFSKGLAAAMESLREEDEALTAWADQITATDAHTLSALPNAVLKRVLDRLYGKPLDRLHFYEIAALIRLNPPSGQVQITGSRFFRLEYGNCVFVTAAEDDPIIPVTPNVPAAWQDVTFSIRLEEFYSSFTLFDLDCDKIKGNLVFRRKRPGDMFRPAGKSGTARLQKRLKNDRVPRSRRDSRWVLCNEQGTVIWAEHYGAAEGFACNPATKRKFTVQIGNNKGDL